MMYLRQQARTTLSRYHQLPTTAAAAAATSRLFSQDASNPPNSNNQNNGNGASEFQQKIKQLEEELKTTKEQMLYCLADQENVRRIAKKDVADAKAYGVTQFAKSLIDVADVMEKATSSVAQAKSEDPQIQGFIEGVKAIEHNMMRAFKNHGVEPYAARGEKFDPNRHEALAQVADATTPPGSLYSVMRRGWLLHGRVLRAAQVVVSIAPPPIEPAFLERKIHDQVDEADDEEKVKEKLHPNAGGKNKFDV
jgi:molecular chaperone GrpE